MKPLTRDKLAGNAFRTLGLGGAATQADIDAAARRMRIWPDPRRIPPTPWDLPWLGPLSRTRIELEQAVACLAEPRTRLQARLTWYVRTTPPAAGPTIYAAPDSDPSLPMPAGSDQQPVAALPIDQASIDELSRDFAAHQDVAIAHLHAATVSDPECKNFPRWRDVVGRFDALSAGDAAANWLARCEADGQFEKRASPEEIRSALSFIRSSLAATLLPLAQSLIDRNELRAAAEIVSLIRSGIVDDEQLDLLSGLLDRIEDEVAAQCKELDRELRDVLRTDHSAPAPYYSKNHGFTVKAKADYDRLILPGLTQVQMLAADDEGRLARVQTRCGTLLALLALGWEWSGNFVAARETLEQAATFTEGTPSNADIRADLERVRPKAEQQLQQNAANRTGVFYAPSPSTFQGIPNPANSPQNWRLPPEPQRRRLWPLILGAIVVGVGLFGARQSSRQKPNNVTPLPSRWLAPARPPNEEPAEHPATRPNPFGESSREP